MENNRLLGCLILICVLQLLEACHKQTSPKTLDEGEIASCSTVGDFFPSVELQKPISGFSFGSDQITWESDFLRRMGEPSLFACSTGSQEASYRLLWDRSLSQPISARLVVHQNGTGTLFVRMLAHAGIPFPPPKGHKAVSLEDWYRVTLDRKIALTTDQVAHALELFRRIRFKDELREGITTDGSDWIIESNVNGKYRLVDFRNGHSSEARNFGTNLVVDLAGVDLPATAVY
jgi:hypothetical protein